MNAQGWEHQVSGEVSRSRGTCPRYSYRWTTNIYCVHLGGSKSSALPLRLARRACKMGSPKFRLLLLPPTERPSEWVPRLAPNLTRLPWRVASPGRRSEEHTSELQ